MGHCMDLQREAVCPLAGIAYATAECSACGPRSRVCERFSSLIVPCCRRCLYCSDALCRLTGGRKRVYTRSRLEALSYIEYVLSEVVRYIFEVSKIHKPSQEAWYADPFIIRRPGLESRSDNLIYFCDTPRGDFCEGEGLLANLAAAINQSIRAFSHKAFPFEGGRVITNSLWSTQERSDPIVII